ncbi:MAG: TonB-dependent receptor [Prevotellaceae bacterium]|nr:TonB-dependent receptor [Prevotellaceae bacterium]
MIVSGRRLARDVVPAQTLSGKALQRLSAHSVADAIRYFAGVQIKDYGGVGGLKTVNIRSLGTHHVGVFYDGVQLGNAQNGQIDLGRFSLDNMEAVSLYNGQKSGALQPARDFASANTVYLTSRKPVFDGNKRDNFAATFKTGSFDLMNPSAMWERRWSSRISSAANAEYMYTSGKYKFRYAKKDGYDTTEVRRNGDVGMLRTEATLFGTLRNGDWRAKAYGYHSERGYPGAAVREEPGRFVHQDRQWDDNLFVQTSLRKQFSPFYGLLLNGKYAYDYLHYRSDPRLDVSTMYVENRYRQQEAYVSAAHEFTLSGWWNVSAASDFQYNTLAADLTDFVYPTRYTLLTAAATSLHVAAWSVQASVLHTCVNDDTRTASSAAGGKSAFTPTLAASYKPWRATDFSIRTFYKRIFRLPTFNDLYYTFIGNKQLKPEYTTQYNAGAAYSHHFKTGALQRLDVQADVYYNEVENKIVAMPTDNQFRWTMLNFGYVEIRGIDASVHAQWQAGAVHAGTRAAYTYQRAQDFTLPADAWYGGQIPYIPRHSGAATISGEYKRWTLHYSFIYTGERYDSRANIAENYFQPWYTHDAAASWRVKLYGTMIKITTEINNIFNQSYEVVRRYPMPGANVKLIIHATL